MIDFLFQEKFEIILKSSNVGSEIQGLWQDISERVYSLAERQRELGLGEKVRI